MLNDELFTKLKEGESEHLAFRLFFGHETIETLVAFANSHGGVLLLGISELKEIKGIPDAKENIDQWIHEIQTRTTPRLFPHIEIIEITEKSVVCIFVAEYPVKPVAFEGKYYKRIGKYTQELSIQEAIDFRCQSINVHWDSTLRTGKTVTDISFRKLHRQIERISRKKQCPWEEPLAFLRKYNLTEGNAITNACWLLFLPERESGATIELGRFSSPTVTSDTLTLKTDLFTEAEEAMRFICKHIQEETPADKPIQWQYPLEAIRELVVNMIIHRDYTSDYNSIVKIFDGYIEFYNPGTLPDNLSIKQLLLSEYISRPRNPQIAELFKDSGMFEEYGSGIRRIWTAFIDCGLRPPEFIKLPERLIVRVFRDAAIHQEKEKLEVVNPTDDVDVIDDNVADDNVADAGKTDKVAFSDTESTLQKNFSDREQQVIAFILEHNRISLNEIAQKLNVSKRTILRDMKNLKKGKVIERIGNEKNGYWKINSGLL